MLEDGQRNIELANQAFCDLFAIPAPPSALLGMDCSQAAEQNKHHFKDPAAFVARVDLILAARQEVFGELLEMADRRFVERDYMPIVIDGEPIGGFDRLRERGRAGGP